MNFRGRAEDLVAQTCVEGQARRDLNVVLEESCEIGIAFVFAEVA